MGLIKKSFTKVGTGANTTPALDHQKQRDEQHRDSTSTAEETDGVVLSSSADEMDDGSRDVHMNIKSSRECQPSSSSSSSASASDLGSANNVPKRWVPKSSKSQRNLMGGSGNRSSALGRMKKSNMFASFTTRGGGSSGRRNSRRSSDNGTDSSQTSAIPAIRGGTRLRARSISNSSAASSINSTHILHRGLRSSRTDSNASSVADLASLLDDLEGDALPIDDLEEGDAIAKLKAEYFPSLEESKKENSRDPSPSSQAGVHRRASSVVSSCSSEDGDNESFSSNDLDDSMGGGKTKQNSVDSKTLMANLGVNPTSNDLAKFAAVRANEYINECLFSGNSNDKCRGLDKKKWESIPQYAKSELQVRKHLGKGSFSDAFEVSVMVAVNDESKKLDSSDKEDLDRLIEAKFRGSFKKETSPDKNKKMEEDIKGSGEGDDLDDEIDALFGGPSFKDPSSVIADDVGVGQDKAIQPSRRPVHRTRRQTVDTGNRPSLGVAASFCIRKATHQRTEQKRQMTYAMKCLRPQIRSNAEHFIVGVEDLVNETAVLASLDHPNIVKLHGRAVSDQFRLSDGYFILLDRLEDTLEDRIGRWKSMNVARHGAKGAKIPSLGQLKTAASIADALSYLHSRDIIFRDLKPANVGFDSQGVLKLFDFGFAFGMGSSSPKNTYDELDQGDLDQDESYAKNKKNGPTLLYEKCGTPRYMAPEVALARGYSLPADVHSFGILLWEICALKKPFHNIKSSEEFTKTVFEKGSRPKLSKYWNRALRDIMAGCWCSFPGKRPRMDEVKTMLAAHVREASSVSHSRSSSGDMNFRKSMMRRLSS